MPVGSWSGAGWRGCRGPSSSWVPGWTGNYQKARGIRKKEKKLDRQLAVGFFS